MNNNNNIEILRPLIFSKKVNLKHKIIPLDVITGSICPIRHFPPATKEWFNSIYTFNKASVKNLTVADKTLTKLIRAYFNFYINNNKILRNNKISKRIKRLSLNKIFISKAELKHTNSKVNITLYVYNQEKIILTQKLKDLQNWLFTSSNNLEGLPLNLLHDIEKYKTNVPLMTFLERLQLSIHIKLSLLRKINSTHNKLEIIKLESSLEKITDMIALSKNNDNLKEILDQAYAESIRKIFLYKEIKQIASLKLLLKLNESKFDDEFLLKLKTLIGKIYNKQVEFNIVNLKTLYFNSDIFTEAISIRLKNRNNLLLNVLSHSLHLVNLPTASRIRGNFVKLDRDSLSHLNNLHVNDISSKYIANKDTLDQLLLDILPHSNLTSTKLKVNSTSKDKESLDLPNNYSSAYNPLDLVLNSLNYKTMSGVRLEAKGRLTKRFTASRSVIKVKWKGSIKNLDSSFNKLPVVLLRGHAKSNLQYSIQNSKSRNGAFGVKGWISSK